MENETVLGNLEQEIAGTTFKGIAPLPVDRWLASSILQKTIRRGDHKTARKAALTYWRIDAQSFYRRLAVIALEDIGVASPEVLVQVLSVCHASTWRKRVGDKEVALYLTDLLCGAVKTRLSDQIFSITANAPEWQAQRLAFSKERDQGLADIVTDDHRALPDKCLALWFLAGTKRYPFDNLPQREGCLDFTAEVLQSLKAPADLTNACIVALTRSQYPLALWTPLLLRELQKMKDRQEMTTPVSSPSYKAIPFCAIDQFTRVGKTSLRQLQSAVPALKPFTTQQIGLGVFYTEGGQLDKSLTSDALELYRVEGEFADIEGARLCIPEYLGLRDILIGHADFLDDIRRKNLIAYLDTAQTELAFGDQP